MATDSSPGGHEKRSQATAPELPASLSSMTLARWIDQSPAALLVADAPDVRISVANAAARRIRGETPLALFGLPPELHTRHWRWCQPDGSWFPPEELPLARAVLRGESTTDVDLILRRDDGEERWVVASAVPLRDADSRITGGIMTFADMTPWR